MFHAFFPTFKPCVDNLMPQKNKGSKKAWFCCWIGWHWPWRRDSLPPPYQASPPTARRLRFCSNDMRHKERNKGPDLSPCLKAKNMRQSTVTAANSMVSLITCYSYIAWLSPLELNFTCAAIYLSYIYPEGKEKNIASQNSYWYLSQKKLHVCDIVHWEGVRGRVATAPRDKWPKKMIPLYWNKFIAYIIVYVKILIYIGVLKKS